MSDNDEEFDDVFMEAAYEAYLHAETEEERLASIAFVAGVSPEDAMKNVCLNAPEIIVRHTLAGIFQGLVDEGKTDVVLKILVEMAEAAARLGLKPGDY